MKQLRNSANQGIKVGRLLETWEKLVGQKSEEKYNDLRGVFLITSIAMGPIMVKDSKNILMDLHQLMNGEQAEDKENLIKIALLFGYASTVVGKQCLGSMRIGWIESNDSRQNRRIVKAFENEVFIL